MENKIQKNPDVNTLTKMRNKKLGKYLKPIVQYTLEGEFIKEWKGTSEACKELGFSNGQISDCLHGKHEQARGYKWEFKNIVNKNERTRSKQS